MGRPVMLVHGMLGQRHVYWNLLARRLRRAGRAVEIVELPLYLLGDLRLASHHLKDHIERTRKEHEADQVDIVAHSAGGLVARYYLWRLGGAATVAHLVTMGTPHQGTFTSYLGLPILDVVRQTRPGSEFLREVDRATADRTVITNLWSPVDGVVWPAERGILPGATNHRVFATHWDYLWRPDLHGMVVQAVEAVASA